MGCSLHGGQCGNFTLFHNWANHFNLGIQLHLNNICMYVHAHRHTHGGLHCGAGNSGLWAITVSWSIYYRSEREE